MHRTGTWPTAISSTGRERPCSSPRPWDRASWSSTPRPRVRTAGDLDHLSVVENIRHLQERTRVVIAMETFWDTKRILTPDQIMNESMPMVLDTSRLPKSEITWVIESYHTHIVNLHLSAVTRDRELQGDRKAVPAGGAR